MKITFTAEAMSKPQNMSITASLAWDYLEINKGCWLATELDGGAILVTDEGADMESARLFDDELELMLWLEQVAKDHLSGTPEDAESFLVGAGAVSPYVASKTVLAAVVDCLMGKENREI